MEGVQFRKKLDFSKIIPHKREGKIAISPSTRKKLRKICRRIKRSLDEIETPPEVHLMSSQDIEITSIWNREEVARIGSLQGVVKFGKRQQR